MTRSSHLRLIVDNGGVVETPRGESCVFVDTEFDDLNDDAMNERIAKLEASQETIRAEMRAATAEIKQIVDSGRADVRSELASMRATVAEQVGGLRVDLHKEVAGIHGKITGILLAAIGIIITTVVSAVILYFRLRGS